VLESPSFNELLCELLRAARTPKHDVWGPFAAYAEASNLPAHVREHVWYQLFEFAHLGVTGVSDDHWAGQIQEAVISFVSHDPPMALDFQSTGPKNPLVRDRLVPWLRLNVPLEECGPALFKSVSATALDWQREFASAYRQANPDSAAIVPVDSLRRRTALEIDLATWLDDLSRDKEWRPIVQGWLEGSVRGARVRIAEELATRDANLSARTVTTRLSKMRRAFKKTLGSKNLKIPSGGFRDLWNQTAAARRS